MIKYLSDQTEEEGMGRARKTHKSNKVRISLYIRELYEAVGQIVSDRVSHTVCTEFARVKLLF